MTPAARTRRRTRPLIAIATAGLLAAFAVAEASTQVPSELVAQAVAAAPTASLVPTPAPPPEPTENAGPTEDAGPATGPVAGPTLRSGPRMRVALRSAGAWQGRATYLLEHESGRADVAVTRLAGKVRVDVTTEGATSSLITTDAGTVACQTSERTTCVLVAAPGAPIPDAFDTGLSGLLFTRIPVLADLTIGIGDGGWLPEETDANGQPVAAGACARVVSPPSRYCVTEAGLLRRATMAAGTLTLVAAVPDVDPAAFTAPVPAVPLA